MKRLTIYLTLLLILAACGGDKQEVEIPTRVAVVDTPTIAPTETVPTAMPTVVSAVGSSSSTPTNTAEPTVDVPIEVATETLELTPTLTVTPSMTITDTPSPTPTITPTPTYPPPQQSGILSLAKTAAHTTVLPPTYYPTIDPNRVVTSSGPSTMPPPFNIISPTPPAAIIPTTAPIVQCSVVAPGGFGTAMTNDPTLSGSVGCPTTGSVIAVSGATQQFEHGFMAWVGITPSTIYVFFNDGTFQRFDDTFDPNIDPESGGQIPPTGLLEPVRGFGKVWRNSGIVQSGLGWAMNPEQGTSATLLEMTQGRMIYFGNRSDILILINQGSINLGTWRNITGTY